MILYNVPGLHYYLLAFSFFFFFGTYSNKTVQQYNTYFIRQKDVKIIQVRVYLLPVLPRKSIRSDCYFLFLKKYLYKMFFGYS